MSGPGGRPPIGPRRAVRADVEEWAYVDAIAAERGLDPSAAVRSIIRDHMAAFRVLAESREPPEAP